MDVTLALRAAGVGLVLAVTDSRLPEVLHWGGDTGEVDDRTAAAMAHTNRLQIAPNGPDAPVRLAIIPEGRTGWTGTPGLSGSRGGEAWTPDWRVTQVLLDGVPVTGVVNACAGSAVFDAADDLAGLGLRVTVEMLPVGLVRARARVTNLRDEPYQVEQLACALPIPSGASELLDFAGRWGSERIPQRAVLTVGQHRRESRHGRTGADSAFVLHAGRPGFGYADGEIWAVHTAWSGNHVHLAERDYLGLGILAGGELLLPGEVRLGRDESYESPWLYGNHATGLDGIAARFHGFVRGRPGAPGDDRPVTLNVWEAVYFDHDPGRLIDLAERAARVGIERYVLDDGWFGGRRNDHAGLGDWVVSRDVWPDGLHPLVDRVKALGMQFGLWFEPEMVNIDSEVARAHPEWIMQPAGRLPVEARFQQVLNLGIPEAYAHVRDQVSAILTEYAIDSVKWDHNRDLVDAGTTPSGRPGVHEQTLAFYRLLDELRALHPGVEFESCSSGGGRIDLEVLQRADRVWVSDTIDPEERQRMLWWTGQLVPPEFLGSHIASGRSHTTGRMHDLSFRAMTAVFGHLGVEWDLAQASVEEEAALTRWIAWYKANRGVLLGGRVVRVDMGDPDVWFKGVIGADKAIFSLSASRVGPTVSLGKLRFPGLDPEALWRVRVWDEQLVPLALRVGWSLGEIVLPGRVLGEVGVRAPAMQPASVVLFELERVS